MKTFLEEVSDALLQQYSGSLDELCLIFPNKRARTFFDRHLHQKLEKTAWAPRYTTINRLMEELSDLQQIDPLKLIFRVYKSYGKHTGSGERFDSFFFWGETLLADFDDIDKYLVNAHDLFQNLASLKQMEDTFSYLTAEQIMLIKRFWNTFNTTRLSNDQQHFIAVWEVLKGIYDELRNSLLEQRVGYEGMIYRDVAEKIREQTLDTGHYLKYVFIGFNALNKVEHMLFDHLQKHDKALFFWDYDEAYTGQAYHEAGRFMRENIRLYPENDDLLKPSCTFDPGDKYIKIVAATGDFEQAKIIPGLLAPFVETEQELDRTAIVLADEQLLVPVLYNIPPEINQVNVTMGYPLSSTALYKLIENVLQLLGYVHDRPGKPIHFQLLLPLLTHPLAGYLFNDAETLHRTLIEKNMQYVPPRLLDAKTGLDQLLSTGSSAGLAGKLMNLLKDITTQTGKELSSFEMEQVYTVYKQLNRLNEIVKEEDVVFTPKTFLRLLKKIMKNATVSFVGEPLSGLQVMGILETRALDFDNLVILSLNEGVYPKPSNVPSFVPQNLRRAFGLPTPEHQDAIYAYYFYRLLHRAKNVACCFNDDIENSDGEISRFLKQLQFNIQYHTQYEHVPNTIGINAQDQKAIEKDTAIMNKLKQYTTHGNNYLSPSALNTYLDCPVKFYYRYLLGLKEAEEITEEIDALVFGNILHRTVELIYKNIGSNEITARVLDDVIRQEQSIEQFLEQAIGEHFVKAGQEQVLHGNNAIIQSVISKYVRQVLEVDKRYAPFSIEGLEGKFERYVAVQQQDNTLQVRIGGKIDRIDVKNGVVRIVDYKTGSKKNTFKDMDEIFWRPDEKRPSAVFQVLLYSYLYGGEQQGNLEPHLVFVRDIFSDDHSSQVLQTGQKQSTPLRNYGEVAESFQENLRQLLHAIYDPAIPFTQTNELKHCERCEFRRFCWK